MEHPRQFEDYRYVGDKRTQRVYDLDDPDMDPSVIAELIDAETFICFGPDTLTEAANRGYRPA